MKTITISVRRYETLLAAENVARAAREVIAAPVSRPDVVAQKLMVDWLIYWLERAPKKLKYELPQSVPVRWRKNRDRSAGL